LLNNPRLDQLN